MPLHECMSSTSAPTRLKFPCSAWKDAQHYLEHGPEHLIARHGPEFASGAALLAAGETSHMESQ